MGFLSRSKSHRSKPVLADRPRPDALDSDRGGRRRQEQSSQNKVVSGALESPPSDRPGTRSGQDLPQATQSATIWTGGRSQAQRHNPLPTPDKDITAPLPTPTKIQTIEIKADSQVFQFPTPVSTPRNRTHPNSDASIGIALGSPRWHPPNSSDSPRALPEPSRGSPLRTYSEPVRTPMTARPSFVTTSSAAEPPKLKKSKSRSFRSLFAPRGPKPPASPLPLPPNHWQLSSRASNASRGDTSVISSRTGSYATTVSTGATSYSSVVSADNPVTAKPAVKEAAPTRDTTKLQRTLSRQRPGTDSTKATKAGTEKAKEAPTAARPKPATMQIFPNVQMPPPIKKGKYTEIVIPDVNEEALEKINNGTGGVQQSSLLDVDIPKSEMERYSVMFEKLLKPRQSLAERRGTLKRLRPLGDETMLQEPDSGIPRRRATSPSLPSRPSPSAAALETPTRPSPKPSPGRDIIEKSIQETNAHHLDAVNRLLEIQRTRAPTLTKPAEYPMLAPGPPTLSHNRVQQQQQQQQQQQEEEEDQQRERQRQRQQQQQQHTPSPGDEATPQPSSPLWSEASLPSTPGSSAARTFFSNGSSESMHRITITPAVARESQADRERAPKRMDSLDPDGTPPTRSSQSQKQHHQQQQQQSQQDRAPQSTVYGQVGVARTVSLTRGNKAGSKHTPVMVKQARRPRVVDVDPSEGGCRKSKMGTIVSA